MKRMMIRVLAVILLCAILLGGCFGSLPGWLQQGLAISFEDMVYTRPDVAAFRQELTKAMEAAASETKVDKLMETVYSLYGFYYEYSTNLNLANIRFFQDMTDIYWSQEYNYCLEYSTEVTAGMDNFLRALAKSPLRKDLEADEFFGKDFFAMYDGETLWTEEFTQLMNQENDLMEQYYDISTKALEVPGYSLEYFEGYGLQLEQIYVELIRVRQQIAASAGYSSYPEFAYSFYFNRDYTPEQTNGYLAQVQTELVPLYEKLDDSVWRPLQEGCSQQHTFDYVKECAQAMGGVAKEAFDLMSKANLYDITYSENKYNASFEVFLISYYEPFIFMNPMGNQRDKLTFVHEFGHFCNDYAAFGSTVGIDVAEVFSQGMEYLSLGYCQDTQDLTRMKMADSLCVFVEQSAYASFEHQVYLLDEEDLTVEGVRGLYGKISEDFGFPATERDPREYTLIPHLFIQPMYVISYVVSNDVAMQIYAKELETKGKGLELWENKLPSSHTSVIFFFPKQ